MNIIDNENYRGLLNGLIDRFPDWDKLSGKRILVTGASGMIGSMLIDAVMVRNDRVGEAERCRVLATSRDGRKAAERFGQWLECGEFTYIAHDISEPFKAPGTHDESGTSGTPDEQGVPGASHEQGIPGGTGKPGLYCAPGAPDMLPDIIIHAASTTHPVQYASEPVNTIRANVLGCSHMLELASAKPGARLLMLSSVEIYGENRGDTDKFDENYCGYIDCNTLRAGYPESKRLCEAMCQAHIKERRTDAVIIRLPRSYGPTMRMSDTKAIAQFIKKGMAGEDIVLKSAGNQLYSYSYAADAVLGMLYVITRGKTGEAYNLASDGSDITLKELAGLVAGISGGKVVFELPEGTEQAGYSTATKALLDARRLESLGWQAHYDIRTGLTETLRILKELTGC